MLCFDAGANFGNRIQPMLASGARVVAIEPQEECVKYLKRKYGKKIVIVAKGLDKVEGKKILYTAQSHVLASFSESWIKVAQKERFNQYRWKKDHEIEMTTLDNLIGKYGKPYFIKIDVEGYEPEVLKGLSQPVSVLSFEYTVPELNENLQTCFQRLNEIYSGNLVCNYSIGESMRWALPEWLSIRQMRELVQSEEFINTSFGDIYVRQHNN